MTITEIEFPEYEYGTKQPTFITKQVDTEAYFKSVNEVIEYFKDNEFLLEDNPEDDDFEREFNFNNPISVKNLINEIQNAINKSKTAFFMLKQISSLKSLIAFQFKTHYTQQAREKYEPQLEELLTLKRDVVKKSWSFIKENWTEIKSLLEPFSEAIIDQQKLRLKISQAKYYLKKKQALGKVNKPTLSPEEKAEKYKEQLKKANAKYYEKKRKELIDLGVMKEKQTEDEKKQIKKERNKNYYQSKILQKKNEEANIQIDYTEVEI
jgi:hypothetical protein